MLYVLRDKIKLNTLFRKLIDFAVFPLFEKSFILVITRRKLDLNVTVVLDTARKGRLDDRCAFDPPESVGRVKSAGNLRKEIVDMAWTSPRSARRWRVG